MNKQPFFGVQKPTFAAYGLATPLTDMDFDRVIDKLEALKSSHPNDPGVDVLLGQVGSMMREQVALLWQNEVH